MKKKIALIFGITGQDGSYLSEFLIKKNYIVHGVKRRSSSMNTSRVDHIYQDPHENKRNFFLHYGDITDSSSVSQIINDTQPNEIYNLAAQSHVAVSFEVPEYTANADGLGVLRILEAIRFHRMEKKIKFYQAGTSEMFGKVQSVPQNEKTNFYPLSPYGVAKLYGHWITKNYRESYDMFNVSGILFNHESERRGIEFVTRKITDGVAKIHLGLQDKIMLGNLDAERDWGYAPDYCEAMWLMLQQDSPEDYVVATGETHSIKEFLDVAFHVIGVTDWSKHVGQDQRFMRPADVHYLAGDSTKARNILGWKPKTSFDEMVANMVKNDINLLKLNLTNERLTV